MTRVGVVDPVGGPVEVASRRYGVAVHEIAHVAAARYFGRDVGRIELTTDGGGQMWAGGPRRGTDRRTAAWEEAVISLAGPVCTRRWAGGAFWTPRDGSGCQFDERDARKQIRRAGGTYAAAWSEAARIVRARWAWINAEAERLYRKGRM